MIRVFSNISILNRNTGNTVCLGFIIKLMYLESNYASIGGKKREKMSPSGSWQLSPSASCFIWQCRVFGDWRSCLPSPSKKRSPGARPSAKFVQITRILWHIVQPFSLILGCNLAMQTSSMTTRSLFKESAHPTRNGMMLKFRGSG